MNPHCVKKTKKIDKNNPVKNDCKDSQIIVGLVIEGRYRIPYLTVCV